MFTVAGIDGCRGGWALALVSVIGPRRNWAFHVASTFREAVDLAAGAAVIAVDVPIGLAEEGPRTCDREARRLLGLRGSSVFPAPVRAALRASGPAEARRLSMEATGRSLPCQTLAILPRIREVDAWMTPARQRRVIEVHPEMSFLAMNGGRPVTQPKKQAAGRAAREALLRGEFPGFHVADAARQLRGRTGPGGPRAGPDDLLDALAAAWTALRRARGASGVIPAKPERDARGLEMAIHC